MNALSHLGHAAQLIREADPNRGGRWILYALHKKLKIKPANHKDPGDHLIAEISAFDIRNSVLNSKWDLIERRIKSAIKKGVLE